MHAMQCKSEGTTRHDTALLSPLPSPHSTSPLSPLSPNPIPTLLPSHSNCWALSMRTRLLCFALLCFAFVCLLPCYITMFILHIPLLFSLGSMHTPRHATPSISHIARYMRLIPIPIHGSSYDLSISMSMLHLALGSRALFNTHDASRWIWTRSIRHLPSSMKNKFRALIHPRPL